MLNGLRSNPARGIAVAALCVAPAIWLVREAALQSLDAPYWDEWTLAELVVAQREGTLRLAQLFAPHNEHRPALARLVLLGLASHTNWDAWAGVVAVLVAGMAAAALGCLLVHRCAPAGEPRPPWWTCPAVAALMLSLNQWENWLWGWQVAVFLTLIALLGTLALLAGPPVTARRLAAAIALATAGSFCFANGLLTWVAALPLLWANGGRQRRWLAFAWSLAALATGTFYLAGLGPVGVGQGPEVWRTAGFLLAYLGAPLANAFGPGWARLVGACGLAALCALLAHPRTTPRAAAFWAAIGLAGFSLASGIAVGLGRGAFIDAPTVATKYVSFANLFWLALLVAAVAVAPRRPHAPAIALLVATGALVTGFEAKDTYTERKRDVTRVRHVLLSADNDAWLRVHFPAPDYLRDVLPRLRQYELSVFDCEDREMRQWWRRAAAELSRHARAGDTVTASNDWAARCLARSLPSSLQLSVTSAGESAGPVHAAMARGPGQFLLAAGDVVSREAREAMRSAFPIDQRPGVPIWLFYAGDRLDYLRHRQPPEDLERDVAALAAADVVGDGSAFLLDGWSGAEQDRGGSFRWGVGPRSTIYVPVNDAPPRTLELTAVPFSAPGDAQKMTVRLNGSRLVSHTLAPGATRLTIDLSSAPWEFGANVLEFEYARAVPPASVVAGSSDTRPLAVRFSGVVLRR